MSERVDVQFLELLITIPFSLINNTHQEECRRRDNPRSAYFKPHNSFLIHHEGGVMLEDSTCGCRIGQGRDYLALEYVVGGEP